MILLALVLVVAFVLLAGFLSSVLPGVGLTPMLLARYRLAMAATPRETAIALIGVMRIALLLTVSGLFRLVAFASAAAMIFVESLADRVGESQLPSPNEISKEIENGS